MSMSDESSRIIVARGPIAMRKERTQAAVRCRKIHEAAAAEMARMPVQ
jgi:hypothetical protein